LLSPLTEIIGAERDRTVPPYVSLARYLGGLVVAFFCLEIATGILLMIYYRPSIGAAHLSTGVIIDEVNLGWLIRSLHRRGADLIVFLISLHLIRVYFSRAYQNPRQLTWASGILLLLVVVAFDLTGVLLPWDQYAYWSTDFLKETLTGIPLAGDVLVTILWGGASLGEAGLLRFYAFHIAVLPWVALFFLSSHLFMVWRFGFKQPARRGGAPPVPPIPFFPDFLVDLLIAFLLTFGLLLSIAILFPSHLGEQADPVSPLLGVQPRWYLMPVHQLLQAVSTPIAVLLAFAVFFLLFFLPVLDAGTVDSARGRTVRLLVGLLAVAAWVLLGVREYFF
jgi:quinol-cytochrome oxidoreductase complex cytochrome b subunit